MVTDPLTEPPTSPPTPSPLLPGPRQEMLARSPSSSSPLCHFQACCLPPLTLLLLLSFSIRTGPTT